jgi:hypothetical protein
LLDSVAKKSWVPKKRQRAELAVAHQLATTVVGRQKNSTPESGLFGRGRPEGARLPPTWLPSSPYFSVQKFLNKGEIHESTDGYNVTDKEATGFADGEEDAMSVTAVVPFHR